MLYYAPSTNYAISSMLCLQTAKYIANHAPISSIFLQPIKSPDVETVESVNHSLDVPESPPPPPSGHAFLRDRHPPPPSLRPGSRLQKDGGVHSSARPRLPQVPATPTEHGQHGDGRHGRREPLRQLRQPVLSSHAFLPGRPVL